MKSIFKSLRFWFGLFAVILLVAIPIFQNKLNYHVFRFSSRERVAECTTAVVSGIARSLTRPMFLLSFPEVHDRCYARLAKETNNVALCRSIWGDYEQNKCVAGIAVILDDISQCNQSYKPGWCQALVGELKLDSNICLQIAEVGFKDRCLESVFRYSGRALTVDQCQLITDLYTKGSCLSQIAALHKDASICPSIEDDYMRDHCYGQVGLNIPDATFCDKIVNTGIADTCYINVANLTHDPALCEKVAREYFRNECKNQ